MYSLRAKNMFFKLITNVDLFGFNTLYYNTAQLRTQKSYKHKTEPTQS